MFYKDIIKIKFTPAVALPDPVKEPLEPNQYAEATRIILDAVDNLKEYRTITKVEKVQDAGFSDNTDAFYSAQYLTTTTTFIEIPAAIQKLEASYQNTLKSQAQGKMTNEEFSKLPIQTQIDRYSAAKIVSGTSPLELFKEKAIAKITAEKAKTPITTGNLGGTTKETLQAAPTY